jgi:murein DD-endopeptidase MepM/ murein hydrolase activator NlpD
MRIPRSPAVLWLAYCLLALSLVSAEPRLYLEGEVDQGGFSTILVSSKTPISYLTCRLLTRDGKPISSSEGFIPADGEIAPAMMSLLGIPHTLSPGTYPLSVEGKDGEGSFTLKALVAVRQKSFIYEEIPLTQAMSELRESDDPRKVEEARKLMGLYQITRPESLYHEERLRLPVAEERRTAFFGDKRKYLYPDGTASVSIHYGIDFGGRQGTPVFSAGKGRVVMAVGRIITGLTVVIEHLPGVYTAYFHLSEILVKEGDEVQQGVPIGKLGATGFVTGPHLHWEFRVSGVPVSPDRGP